MKIVILSATCSKSKYEEICKKRTVKSLDTNQNFFLSIINGLIENNYKDITCISLLPVSYATFPERIIDRQEEFSEGINYIYCKTINLPYIRNLYASFQIKKELKKFLRDNKNEEIVMIADGLFYELKGVCDYTHKMKKKIYAIVTDVPSFVSNMGNETNIKGKLLDCYGSMANKAITKKYDGYVFLTKYLNNYFNRANKPFRILEGLLGNNQYPKKEKKDTDLPVVLYAGKLNKEFGVLALAQASKYLHGICNIEIYGANGDCDDELNKLCLENLNLKIHGIISLNELLKKEVEADLLINPRPSGQYFTKFSFPSKTLEYMASGTPVLMYKLEGIPDEYDKYLLYMSGTSPIDIANSIKTLLCKSSDELLKFGFEAKKFVEEKKCSKCQVKKIVELIENDQ